MQRCGGAGWRAGVGALLAVGLIAVPGLAWPAAKKPSAKSSGDAACVDAADPPRWPWQKILNGGTCFEFSNNLSFVYQKLLRSAGSPPTPARAGTASIGNPEVKTVTFKPSLETTTPTGLGDFKTSSGVSVQRTSDDTITSFTLSEATASLAGVTAGYTDSAMNFWSGDFQFSAAAPARTVAVARYEYEVIPDGKLGLSLETGVPTKSTNSKVFVQVFPDDPVLVARWLYETDPLTVQIAAMTHEARFTRENSHPVLGARSGSIRGWAATAGTTVAVPALGEDDEVSAQATYAVNSSPYLGTNSDLSTLASTLPFKVDTRGWSAVASYHRQWSEQWESNVFVSRLALDISTPLGHPTLRTMRYAANLIFKPHEDVKIGAELGFVEVRITPNGALGILRGASGELLTGYLFVEVDF